MVRVNSLPIEYLPQIKLKNELEIAEGTTYVFHVPLKLNSDKTGAGKEGLQNKK